MNMKVDFKWFIFDGIWMVWINADHHEWWGDTVWPKNHVKEGMAMANFNEASKNAKDAKTARDKIKSRGQQVPDEALHARGETETTRRDLKIAAQHAQGIRKPKDEK